MLTLPRMASFIDQTVNETARKASARMSGLTGISRQAAMSSPMRRMYQMTELSATARSAKGSIATPSGGA